MSGEKKMSEETGKTLITLVKTEITIKFWQLMLAFIIGVILGVLIK